VGDDLSIKPRAGVLLLNNGELIAGTIITAGDRYDVQLENGEISIRRSEVALVCRDAQECYARKRAGIESGRAQDHLDLAEWCIKNGLLEAGERELAAARAADHAHPKIRLVESRLALAKEPPPSGPVESPQKRAAPESLDGMARNLPPGTMEQFTNTIQPLLLNYCAKSGCHAGRGAGGLQLERMHPKLAGRFSTQRNLRRVLAQVDLADPTKSKLLQAPIRPHGPAQATIFTDREQSQYRQLAEWVHALAGTRRSAAPEPTLAERTAPLLQAVPGASGAPAETDAPHELPHAEPAASELPAPAARDGSQIPASSAEQGYTREQLREMGLLQHATSRVQYSKDMPAPYVPKDPFDPELFNRRYFGR
jgi:hypothetical protein